MRRFKAQYERELEELRRNTDQSSNNAKEEYQRRIKHLEERVQDLESQLEGNLGDWSQKYKSLEEKLTSQINDLKIQNAERTRKMIEEQ
jgi:F0F1-type ATP synthase membrane subunit b/b'